MREHAPPIHNLNRLAKIAGIELDKQAESDFVIITAFNIESRYPDFKRYFRKICTQQFTEIQMEKNKEAFQMAKITNELTEIIRKYIAKVSQVRKVDEAYIYGSYAKGRAKKWSDIDVAIVSPDFSQDLFEERVFLMKLALNFDDRIEPSPFRPEDFTIDNPLVNEISTSGIAISAE
jgi:uncharacterized protein